MIEDVEPNERIYLTIDSEEYHIRTWNFHLTGIDMKNNINVLSEMVEYTLFKMGDSHGEKVDSGMIEIEWEK